MKRIAILALIVISVIAVSAGAVYYQGAYIPPSGVSPTVTMTSPSNGDTVRGSTVTVEVSSSNFNVPAQGHYHVFLDSSVIMAYNPTSTVTFTNVAPGTHTLRVELANPNHTLLNPPVVSQAITITVVPDSAGSGGASPTVTILAPSNGATVSDSFPVTVASTNFNVPAQGHYHVFLGGVEKMAYDQTSTLTFSDVSPGTHTIMVELANPDHTIVSPKVSQTISVNVESSGGGNGGGAQPAITILSPSNGGTVQGPSVTVALSSANFNIPAQGYYYVSMSNGGFITGPGPTFTFPIVTSGTHTITADLRNPDGTMLNPDISQSITITMTNGAGGGGGGYGY